MISKRLFITIMEQCKSIHETICKLDEALGTCLCNSTLDNVLNNLLEGLANETEPTEEPYEPESDAPAVWRYAFDYNWGEGFGDFVDCETWTFEGKPFDVFDLETLYNYLKLHYDRYQLNQEALKNVR